jgi:pSer/pThr/pTyr-binding forkhead associated (FHA) protein
MPKLTLVRDQKTVKLYDLDQSVIRIGRVADMDIQIDDPSVSRRQAEIQQDGGGWVLRDIGSSNGTFVNGERLAGDRPLRPGDEIAIGQFSLFFERGLPSFQPRGVLTSQKKDRPPAPAAPARARGDATMFLSAEEIEQVRKEGAQKRQPHLISEAGGPPTTHYFGTNGGALIGRSALCDVRVARGPRHHILVLRVGDGFEVRNLSWWWRMRVKGQVTSRARINSGDVIEVGRLRLTFVAGDR